METTNDSNGIRNDHHHISFTAYMVAHWRSMTDIPYAKDIAAAIGAERVSREALDDLLEPMTWFGAPMIEARNKALKREVEKIGCKNIYGIAEGALPTGMTRTSDPEVKYLHSDLPVMVSEAEAVLRDLMVRDSLRRPNLRFMSVNALDREQLQNGADYFNGEPFVMTHKGLLVYLPEPEKELAAQEFNKVMVENNGLAWVTTDISFRKTLRNIMEVFGPQYAGTLQKCLARIAERTNGRNIRENFFEDEDTAHSYLDRNGFTFERFPMYDGSFELTSLKESPENMHQGLIDIFKDRYVYVMKPKK